MRLLKAMSLNILFLLILSSCGKDKESSGAQIAWEPIYTNDPLFYNPQLNNCESQVTNAFYQSSFFSLTYDVYSGVYLESRTDFSNFKLSRPLRTDDSVSQVVFHAEEVMEVNMMTKRRRYARKSPGKKLLLCPNEDLYEEESIEAVAISVLPIVHESYEFGKGILGNIKLDPVKVSLHPREIEEKLIKKEDKHIKETKYMTDNAYYSPRDKTIAVVPQSKQKVKDKLFSGVPLWKIPFAISHEYGHHVFHTVFPDFFDQLGYTFNYLKTKSCFNRDHDHTHDHSHAHQHLDQDNVHLNKSYVQMDVNKEISLRVLRVFDEGFADLFSYYTLGERASLHNISCLSETREVSSHFFANNDPKSMTTYAATQFFNYNPEKSKKLCYVPDYSDYYTQAAIWAHFIDSILSTELSDGKDKASYVVKWLNEFKQNQHFLNQFKPLINQGKHEEAFIYTIKLFLRMFTNSFANSNQLTSQQCMIVKDSYSAFYEKLVNINTCEVLN